MKYFKVEFFCIYYILFGILITVASLNELHLTKLNKIEKGEEVDNYENNQINQNNNLKNRTTMAHNLRQTYIDRCLQKKIDTDLFLGPYLKSNYVNTAF